MRLFKEKPGATEGIDGIVGYIRSKYSFEPNRETTAFRVSYLVDIAKKLERVEGKRGVYRIASKNQTLNLVQGDS